MYGKQPINVSLSSLSQINKHVLEWGCIRWRLLRKNERGFSLCEESWARLETEGQDAEERGVEEA